MHITAWERTAAVLVGIESVVVLGLAAWQVVSLVVGDVASVPSALALIVLTVAAAAGVAGFAVGIARGSSWARSGAVVTQLLILAVALGAFTGTYGHASTALLIGVPAALVLLCVVAASRVAARRADPRTAED